MEVKVANLREALDILKPVVPKKSKLQVLENVLVRDGEAVATNLESTVILDLPEAQEACLLPFDPVLKLLKYVPGNERVVIERKRGRLNLTWAGGSASYEATDPADYPPVPQFEPRLEGLLDGDSLMPALSSIADYCATDEARPVLCGVTLYLGETLELAAGDGFRMAYQDLPIAFPGKERIVIPSRSVQLLGHLWKAVPRTATPADSLVAAITAKRMLELALDGDLLKARAGCVTMITKLITGSPPEWQQLLIRETPPIRVHVLAPDLERAVRRIRQVAEDSKGIVRLVFEEPILTVSAEADKQRVEATVTVVTSQGGPGKVAVDVKYLLDYLQGKEGVVTIGIKDTSSPVSFQRRESPLVIVMPMNVRW